MEDDDIIFSTRSYRHHLLNNNSYVTIVTGTLSQDRYITIYDGGSRDYLGGALIYPRSDGVEKHIVISKEGET